MIVVTVAHHSLPPPLDAYFRLVFASTSFEIEVTRVVGSRTRRNTSDPGLSPVPNETPTGATCGHAKTPKARLNQHLEEAQSDMGAKPRNGTEVKREVYDVVCKL